MVRIKHGQKWVKEPDDRSRQSSGFHTFTRYTCTVVTRIYLVMTDSVGLCKAGVPLPDGSEGRVENQMKSRASGKK